MNTWYCVNVEFYENGKTKTCLTSKKSREHPKNLYRHVPGMSAFKIWLSSQTVATNLFEQIKSGEVDFDDVLYFYSEYKEVIDGVAA
jgi:hypothetical protein